MPFFWLIPNPNSNPSTDETPQSDRLLEMKDAVTQTQKKSEVRLDRLLAWKWKSCRPTNSVKALKASA